MDVVAVEAAARRAVAFVRAGQGPYFLECRTYRFRAHSMFDAQLYRGKDEVDAWKQRDPIKRFGAWLTTVGMAHDSDIASIERDVDAEVAVSVAYAEAGTWEPVSNLLRDVTTPRGSS
jgi:TPP-dependent pyruvate/acetoin dehydrogenase alpha subunit